MTAEHESDQWLLDESVSCILVLNCSAWDLLHILRDSIDISFGMCHMSPLMFCSNSPGYAQQVYDAPFMSLACLSTAECVVVASMFKYVVRIRLLIRNIPCQTCLVARSGKMARTKHSGSRIYRHNFRILVSVVLAMSLWVRH
ncbi:hypothetical protein DEU56DRAFT_267769 [Suillus clintonianus]|uniref:uncharacterized protein n=1 Tax=Suillus clintonianus TaxID=1904413 RepID=UPI001B8793A1|nr:uncharacterized protein DEU56DRAFT_267769 [Suillus clintonianus]KAG2141843.1 hypothetical protein DEU56DRAFT_267769 [Suillus clintonianus]